MPPKKGGKKKSKKKRLQELEEQRLREEEERRIAEEEERQRLEKLRLEKEEADRQKREAERILMEENCPRLMVESKAFNESLAGREKKLAKAEEKELKAVEWKRALNCSILPDARDVKEVNTYITVLRDDPETNIEINLKNCQNSEDVNAQIEELWAIAVEKDEVEKAKELDGFRKEFRDITMKRMDVVTSYLAQYSDKYLNKKQEVQVCESQPSVKFALWINVARNPRTRAIEFADMHYSMDIPKTLALAYIGIRVVQTNFDQLSPLALEAYAETPEEEAARLEAEAEEAERLRLEEEEKKKLEAEEQKKKDEEEALKHAEELAEATEQGPEAVAALEEARKKQEEDKAREREEKERKKAQEPKKIESLTGTLRPKHYASVGGVTYVELISLPPPVKDISEWSMRPVYGEGRQVTKLPYPMQVEGHAFQSSSIPIRISYKLPPDALVMDEHPHVGMWDYDKVCWDEEGVTDTHFDRESRVLTFTAAHLTAFTVLQPKTLDFPFEHWDIRPSGTDEAILKVKAARYEVQMEICSNGVRILSPQLPELKEMNENYFGAVHVLEKLKKIGMNLVPEAQDFKQNNREMKLEELMSQVQYDLCSTVAGYSICWSKWNAPAGNHRCVVRICENVEWDSPPQPDSDGWTPVCFQRIPIALQKPAEEAAEGGEEEGAEEGSAEKAPSPAPEAEKTEEEKVEGGEGEEPTEPEQEIVNQNMAMFVVADENYEDEETAYDRPEGSSFHSNLATLMAPRTGTEAQERLNDANPRFQETVRFILKQTRLLDFC